VKCLFPVSDLPSLLAFPTYLSCTATHLKSWKLMVRLLRFSYFHFRFDAVRFLHKNCSFGLLKAAYLPNYWCIMYILSYNTKDEHETLNSEWLTASDDMEPKFYGELTAWCRVVGYRCLWNWMTLLTLTCRLPQLDGVYLQWSVTQWRRSNLSSLQYDCITYIILYITKDEQKA